jgi:DinB family protein
VTFPPEETWTSILERLRTQLSSLPVLIEGIALEDLERRVGGKWSVAENVAHLARHTELMRERIQRILAQEEPLFPPYRAEQDADWPAWQARSLAESLERLQLARAALIAEVANLTPNQQCRIGIHARLGPLSLSAWLDFYLVHEGHHLYTITKRARGLE